MFRMDEDRARWIDSATKIIGLIALILGGGWTIYTYFNAKEKETRTALMEVRKPFEAKRLELYFDLAQSAARLAETKDPKEYKKEHRHFYELSIGPLAMAGDKGVGTAVVNFLHRADTSTIADTPCEGTAEEISRACRRSIAESWDLVLPDDAITYSRLEKLRQ